MTDLSSKGLLPQLTDLLRALSDSHELLLCKVQGVRSQLVSTDPSMIEDSRQAPPLDSSGPRHAALVHTKTSVSNELDWVYPVQQIDAPEEPTGHPSGKSDLSSGFVDATSQITYSDAAPVPPCASTEAPIRHSNGDDVIADHERPRSERPTATQNDGAGAEPGDRYDNFFDELDATLAHLEDPESDRPDHSDLP